MKAKNQMDKLTKAQEKTLQLIGYGVRGSFDGHFYSEEDPGQRLDLRSASALYRRKLINWHTRGGAVCITIIDLTTEGEELFDELQKESGKL
jgi:hypothetical protein